MAGQLDIRLVKNNDILVQFSVKDKFGQPMNIADFHIKWQVKKSAKSEPVITKITGSSGGIAIVSASEGVFVVQINALDTINLDPGSYLHEAIVTDTIGKSVTLTDLGLAVGAFYLREQYATQD